MLQYILAGLALGSIYAIAASALIVTFISAGVLNFAFASIAYFVARCYYWFNTQHGWPSYDAAFICLLVIAPLLGILLYASIFRYIRDKSTLVKLCVTIGVSVALPAITDTIFGTQAVTNVPGLASPSDQPFRFLGTPVTTDLLTIYGFLLFILLVGTLVLRYTNVGLRVRAMVDSEAMTSLSGTHPGRISVGVWAVATALTGLAGILVAPSQGLGVGGMAALMSAAFAAVIAARLRSIPGAIAAALAMGVITDVIQKYLSPTSSFTAVIIPSIPFLFILAFLLFYLVRSGSIREEQSGGGPLDHAVRPANDDPMIIAELAAATTGWERAVGALPLVLVAAIPLFFNFVLHSEYWLLLAALGACYAITLLTFTLVIGEGGMVWMSQIIFAGAGALATAQFVTIWHIPVLLAAVFGGIIAAFAGAIIGSLTIRLGDLYVALVTFSFGLLVENLVFTRNRFSNNGAGVPLNPPNFASGTIAFTYLALAVFALFGFLIWNLRRSTTGMALRAVRDSEEASRTLGLSVLQVKVIVSALGAFVAGIGGAFIAMDQQIAQPQYFDTYAGLVWLAVMVAMGVRSITAAALAGMSFALFPGIFQSYVPARWGEIPTILFGLGAIGIARHPEGVVLQAGRQIRSLLFHSRREHAGFLVPQASLAVQQHAEPAMAPAGAVPGLTETTDAAP